jgi:hypothetical protein
VKSFPYRAIDFASRETVIRYHENLTRFHGKVNELTGNYMARLARKQPHGNMHGTQSYPHFMYDDLSFLFTQKSTEQLLTNKPPLRSLNIYDSDSVGKPIY